MTQDRRSSPDIHRVDLHVGRRLRLLRKARGLSQAQLADALGITFQQVQKYERGANRISASRLFEAACAFQVPPAALFEGLPTQPAGLADPLQALADVPEAAALAAAFPRVNPAEVRRALVRLVEVLAAPG